MRSTFKILFYLKRNAPKKSGLVPVMCRITVNGKISQFSCKLDVEEKLWNVQSGKMSGKSLAAQEANRVLDKIRVGVTKAYQEICDKDNYVTAEKVRNAFLGMGQNHKTLLAVFRRVSTDSSTKNNFVTKKIVEYEIDIQNSVLPQTQRPEEKRACTGNVPYHRERQNIPIQLQAGCRGKIMERAVRKNVRQEPRGTRG